ncbi:MAG: methyltransferase, family [Steroidobacteraceae bacterium]|nr:methyltransferase, family [Steroidobacteraceae bacterium]MBM2853553.1 methyltransferase, family [Steroidobacteraceae bacterium]
MTQAESPSNDAVTAARLKDDLRRESASFRKKSARHRLRTRDAIYCAFSTPRFSVARDEAQRDAGRRLQRFGILQDQVRGKRILDLGCNNGAMLFQLSNYGPARSLGIEYDPEKVLLARRIAEFAAIGLLEFRVGDLDQMQAADVGGPFDIVLCLAIEAHVKDPAHLYELLAGVTRGRLYFEANSSTRPDDVRAKLQQVGFSEIVHLGVCDDDVVPRNNRRPLLSAVIS